MLRQWVLYLVYTLFTFLLQSTCVIATGKRLTQLAVENNMVDPRLGYIIPIANSDISILDGKRDYYTLITITSTNPQHGCLLCQEITPVLAKVSKLWHADYSASNFLHFVTVDLNDDTNKPIFRSLNMGTVPHIWMVPPSSVNENRENRENRESGESDEENRTKFDFHSVPFDEFAIPKGSQHQQVLALAKFIGHHTQHTLMIRDENAMEKFIKTFIVVFSVVVLIKKKGPEMITSVPKRTVICFLAIIAILLFTAGYQFTVQNQVPFIAKSNKGEVVFISGGMQYQFAVEVAIVASTYAAMATTTLLLINLGQYQVNEKSIIKVEKLRIGLIIVHCLIIYVLYSCLTSLMMKKNSGYQYELSRLF